MQLLALFVLYVVAGLGCTAAARVHGHRHVGDLVALLVLWPLYAPFVLSDRHARGMPPTAAPVDATVLLETRSQQMAERLAEIDALLATPEWNRVAVQQQLDELADPDRHQALRASLRMRLEHIDRLHFLRKLHADELEAAGALLQQRRAQVQLSRFIEPADQHTGAHLHDIRARILSAEDTLASETELLSLCRES